MSANPFLDMIRHLRTQEEIMLYNNVLLISYADAQEVATYLEQEYKKESRSYPHESPPFNSQAAVWAAMTLYLAAQLLLYREHKETQLCQLFPDWTTVPEASDILSADLCLRFLPDVLQQMKLIDADDKLIQVLEPKLQTWHFSGINYPLEINTLSMEAVIKNACLHQMYVDRIFLFKKISLARHAEHESLVKSSLSIYAQELWNDFKVETL